MRLSAWRVSVGVNFTLFYNKRLRERADKLRDVISSFAAALAAAVLDGWIVSKTILGKFERSEATDTHRLCDSQRQLVRNQ